MDPTRTGNRVKEGTKLLTINPPKMGHLPLFSLFLHNLNYTTFVFQSIFTCYLTLYFGTEALSKRTNAPVGELLFLGEMDLYTSLCKCPEATLG